MKNSILLILLTLVFIFAGCQKIKNLANINEDFTYTQEQGIANNPYLQDPNFKIPPGGISLDLPTVAIGTNAQQYLTQYNTSASKIIGVSLKKLSMQLTPGTSNFDCMDSITVYISGKWQQYLPEIMVAKKYGIAKGLNLLALDTVSANLKNYFLSDSMYIRVNAHFVSLPPNSTTINFINTFNLLANPLN